MFIISSVLILLLLFIIIFTGKQVGKNTKKWIFITTICLLPLNYLLFEFNSIEILLFIILITYILIRSEIDKKAKKGIFIACSIVLLLIISLFIFTPRKWYYRLLYLDDRVKITTNIYVDGEKVDIDKNSIKITGEGVGKTNLTDDKDGFKISFKGNEYSNYNIYMKANDYDFDLVLQHWNWWDINTINLEIEIDTKENTITYSVKNKYISEQRDYREDVKIIKDTKELSETNEIYLD